MVQSPLQYGMTPLMHAAYKGKTDMCKLLLQHGADVNCNEHEHGYTALMFAGLSGMLSVPAFFSPIRTYLTLLYVWIASPCIICYFSAGKTDITWLMLDAGAETDVVNSVGRTAAQMAAFVGMSECDMCSFTWESSVLRTRKDKEPHTFLAVENIQPVNGILNRWSHHLHYPRKTSVGNIRINVTVSI